MSASVIFVVVVLLFVGCGLLTWIAVRGASRAASIEEIAARMQRSASKPEPTATPVAEKPQPEPAPATVQAPQERLAKTGATTDGIGLAIGIIAFGIGVGLVILRLLEGRKHEEETAR